MILEVGHLRWQFSLSHLYYEYKKYSDGNKIYVECSTEISVSSFPEPIKVFEKNVYLYESRCVDPSQAQNLPDILFKFA